MNSKTLLIQKFEKEKQLIKSLVNTLLVLIILGRLQLFYLQQLEEYLLFLSQVLLEFL